MTRISDETRRKVVRAHIQDGRTIASLATEYGISRVTASNWVRSYREECQNNDKEKSQMKITEELRRLRREKANLERENIISKSATAFFAKESDSWHIVSLINISSSSDRDGFLISCTSTQAQITTTSEMLMRIISLKNLIIVNGFKHFQFSYPTHRMSNTMANAVKRRIGLPFL